MGVTHGGTYEVKWVEHSLKNMRCSGWRPEKPSMKCRKDSLT